MHEYNSYEKISQISNQPLIHKQCKNVITLSVTQRHCDVIEPTAKLSCSKFDYINIDQWDKTADVNTDRCEWP